MAAMNARNMSPVRETDIPNCSGITNESTGKSM